MSVLFMCFGFAMVFVVALGMGVEFHAWCFGVEFMHGMTWLGILRATAWEKVLRSEIPTYRCSGTVGWDGHIHIDYCVFGAGGWEGTWTREFACPYLACTCTLTSVLNVLDENDMSNHMNPSSNGRPLCPSHLSSLSS
jgi:hypothetical protein